MARDPPGLTTRIYKPGSRPLLPKTLEPPSSAPYLASSRPRLLSLGRSPRLASFPPPHCRRPDPRRRRPPPTFHRRIYTDVHLLVTSGHRIYTTGYSVALVVQASVPSSPDARRPDLRRRTPPLPFWPPDLSRQPPPLLGLLVHLFLFVSVVLGLWKQL